MRVYFTNVTNNRSGLPPMLLVYTTVLIWRFQRVQGTSYFSNKLFQRTMQRYRKIVVSLQKLKVDIMSLPYRKDIEQDLENEVFPKRLANIPIDIPEEDIEEETDESSETQDED